jgi:hypothetical protein
MGGRKQNDDKEPSLVKPGRAATHESYLITKSCIAGKVLRGYQRETIRVASRFRLAGRNTLSELAAGRHAARLLTLVHRRRKW